MRTGARSCALHVPSRLVCLTLPSPGIRAACAGLGIAVQELTADELRALYGAHALAALERSALGGPRSWDRELAGRTLPAAALAEVIDGYAERVLGYAPLRARRRRERERGPDALLLAGCDPAERYPVLQALLRHDAARVEDDGTVVVAGVRYADEREGLLPYFAGAAVWLVRSQRLPERAWVHLADEPAAEPPADAGAGVGAADTLQQTATGETGETGERADPSTSTLWGAAATGGIHPVCTVVTGELAQRVGWRWPPVEGSRWSNAADGGQRRQRQRA